MDKKFSIGQVSKLYEVSIDTLRYYDKVGLLKPIVNESNGYRFYGLRDLEQLDLILSSRALEIPIKDITKIIKSKEINSYIMLMEKQEKLVSERINSLFKLQKDIAENKNILNEIEEHNNIMNFEIIKPYKDEYTLIEMNVNELLVKKDYKKYLRLLDADISMGEYFYSYSIAADNSVVDYAAGLYIVINTNNKVVIEETIESNNLIIEKKNINGSFVKVRYYGDSHSFNKYIIALNSYFTGKENKNIYAKDYFYMPTEDDGMYYCEIIMKL
ncbi:MerR family transcriptional regulator [Clostridium estertheticum]|uniref:MerR family transcriptional regulator n=1 Tax=Clostridium estertheticum TaxID=238834 RepID=UPI0013E92695|nr:MerR family transcriptional regulator [Clostridium estertheticum]MBZ9686836.1 MerR family transcriptional regulator [Clostridium estertheticum]